MLGKGEEGGREEPLEVKDEVVVVRGEEGQQGMDQGQLEGGVMGGEGAEEVLGEGD